MSKTVTSAVLTVITSYDPGANSDPKKPYAALVLNDLRLYNYSQMGSLSIQDSYLKFQLSNTGLSNPVSFPRQAAYAKAAYSVPLLPLATQGKYGSGPSYTYTEDTTRTAAYDVTSLESLLQTLTVSCLVWTAQTVDRPSTDGSATATLKVYAAYVDVTFSDASTQRCWATGATVLPGGRWAGGNELATPPGTPTTILDTGNALDTDDTTYATIQATNKQVGLSFSALTNPVKLVLDWQMQASCGDAPDGSIGAAYNHQFTATGGTGPYSWAVTSGQLPTGLSLSAGGVASGTPTKAGEYDFTLSVTDSAATGNMLKTTAQAGGAGMTMPPLSVGASVGAAASSAAYMGVNAFNEPYWGLAVAVAPPSPAAPGVGSYVVTVQNCQSDGTVQPGSSERDFGSYSTSAGITSLSLLGNYQPLGSLYTSVIFKLYSVSSGGVRTLAATAWTGSANHQTVTFGDKPADGGSSSIEELNPAGTTTAATASAAVNMGKNSLNQNYYSIAVAVRPGAAAGVLGFQVTATNTDGTGNAGGDDASEKDFFYVSVPSANALVAENLLGLYQTSPTSVYHYVTFKLYSVGTDYTRTLVTAAWNETDNQQTVNYGTPSGTVPAALPKFLSGSVSCSIKILAGTVTANCGNPGIVPLGEAFSFRPTVTSGGLTLDSSYDQDGTLTWVVTGLPPGLVWDNTAGSATYGHIAGLATQAGNYTYTAVITTSAGQTVTLSCPLSVRIVGAGGYDPLCGSAPTGVEGLPYSYRPTFAVGTTYSDWSFTGLPPGLNWDSVAGYISGVPTQIGIYSYQASKTGAAYTCTIVVAVQGDSGQASCGSPGVAVVGLPFSYVPPFTAQAPVASWTMTGLPPGLVWDTDPASDTYGMIAGVPGAEGGWAYHARATLTDGTHLAYTCSIITRLPGSGDDGTDHQVSCAMLDLWVWQPLFEFTSLQQVISLPPAYQRALRYQLAVELAGTYGRSPELVSSLAAQAIADVDTINASAIAAVEDVPAPPPQGAS